MKKILFITGLIVSTLSFNAQATFLDEGFESTQHFIKLIMDLNKGMNLTMKGEDNKEQSILLSKVIDHAKTSSAADLIIQLNRKDLSENQINGVSKYHKDIINLCYSAIVLKAAKSTAAYEKIMWQIINDIK